MIRRHKHTVPRLRARRLSSPQDPPMAAISDAATQSWTEDEEYDMRRLLRAAFGHVFRMTGLVLFTSTVTLTYALKDSLIGDGFRLDCFPIQSIDTLTVDGDTEDVSSATLYSGRRPTVHDVTASGAMAVWEVTAGYGTAWADLPPDAQVLVTQLATDLYEFRSSGVVGHSVHDAPIQWDDLLHAFTPKMI